MRLLPEFFWTSCRYRWVRTHILAFLCVGLVSFLPTPVWINFWVGVAVYLAVIVLRKKEIL